MRTYKWIYYFVGVIAFVVLTNTGCTKLDENVYDIITTKSFYGNKANVIQAYARPFDYAYQTFSGGMWQIQEQSADQLMTPNRQGHWLNGQMYFRLHWHKLTLDDSDPRNAWNNNAQGIAYCNSAMGDLSKLDPAVFGMAQTEIDGLVVDLKTLRAWFILNMFDMFRNIPIVTDYPIADVLPAQKTPKETFNFLEAELKDAIAALPAKAATGGNKTKQGQWNKAGAATMLVRLYLNAKLWIGEDRYTECMTYCNNIINGTYGPYSIDTRWDAPWDWNNETCDELIYGFTSSYGYTHYVYTSNMYWWGAPFMAAPYFGFLDWGQMNHRYGLQPGLDLEGNPYQYAQGGPVQKFKKYPDDVRLNKYRNKGNSTRVGMFLRESLDYIDAKGNKIFCKADNGRYNLYLRDQVGWFEDTDTLSISPKPSSGSPVLISNMDHADQSSGWCVIKYPIYRSSDVGKMESDFAVIRLAEIYYSLAECKFRTGDKAAAEQLLNTVRARNYPAGSPSLYAGDGSELTEQELLDEWGREFIGEGRRRTDLCRFGVYDTEWWDKPAESDKHTYLVIISRDILAANPRLVQNPGY